MVNSFPNRNRHISDAWLVWIRRLRCT